MPVDVLSEIVIGRRLAPLMAGQMKKANQKDLVNLKAILEKQK